MPNCSNCGEFMQSNQVYRREIYVGTTNRVNYGKQISFGNSKHYRKQSVCYNCAVTVDKQNENQSRNLKIVLLLIAILVVSYLTFK